MKELQIYKKPVKQKSWRLKYSKSNIQYSSQLTLMVLKQDYATSEIRDLTKEKLNLLAIKHTHAQFSTVKGFATTALLGLVWPVHYGG